MRASSARTAGKTSARKTIPHNANAKHQPPRISKTAAARKADYNKTMQSGLVVDIVIVALCAFFALRGLFTGFVREVLSLLAFVAGYFAVQLFDDRAIALLTKFFSLSQPIAQVISSALLFIFAYIIVKYIELFLSRFVNLIMLAGLNRVAGFVAGGLKGAVIVLLLAYFVRVQPVFPQLASSLQLDASRALPYLQFLYEWIPAIRI